MVQTPLIRQPPRLADETFNAGGDLIVRKAGEPVPAGLMIGWRQLRLAEPELFHTIRVWQQPCAVVDSIVWRWQTDLEATEYSRLVRVTDCLKAAWSEQSKEAAWLCNQLGVPVASGCTPLQQPTDTHLAKPAKDAGRRRKEELRELMRVAARRDGLDAPTYKTGKRELMTLAIHMHQAMVQLNEKTDVVLQAARGCGWLMYRSDDTGRLKDINRESWAVKHPVASRLSSQHLQNRMTWVSADGRPSLANATPDEHQPVPDWLPDELSRKQEEEPDVCDLELDPFCLFDADSDLKRAAELLLHPSLRDDSAMEQELAKLTPQGKRGRGRGRGRGTPASTNRGRGEARGRAAGNRRSRTELAAGWRTELDKTGLPSTRLAALIPKTTASVNKKKKSADYIARKVVKKAASKKQKIRLKLKTKRTSAGRLKTKAIREVSRRSRASAAKSGGEVPNESWIGKTVRLVGPLAQPIYRNTTGKVQAVGPFGLTVLTIAGPLVDVEVPAVYELSGLEVLGMREELPDLRLVSNSEKALCSAACGVAPKQLKSGALLDDAHMMAGWHEIILRANGRQRGLLPSKNVAVVPAQTGQMLLDYFQSAPGSAVCAELICAISENLPPVEPGPASLLAWPLCHPLAKHWTLLLCKRNLDSPAWEVTYYDSLPMPAVRCRELASVALSVLKHILGSENLPDEVPACAELRFVQKDWDLPGCTPRGFRFRFPGGVEPT